MTGPIDSRRRPASPVPERARNALETSTDVVKTGQEVVKATREIPEQLRILRQSGFLGGTRANWQSAIQSARNPTSPLSFGHVTRFYGAATGALKLPAQALATGRSIRDAIRNPTGENVNAATNSTIDTSRNAVSTASNGLQTVRDVQRGRAAYRAADAAIRQAAPEMAPAVRRAATRAAARSAFTGAAPQVIERAAREAADRAVTRSGTSVARAVVGDGTRTAARQVLTRSTTAAGRAAAPAVARAATSAVARSAGRLVPGVNVAMAALDTAQFASDLRNPNTSTATRISSGVTALGSIAAATNIPVVSQVGAGVAAVGSFARGFFNR